ncbi:hypothetical protein Q8A73_018159 [Channa argus]|nr:hypothetical protein Q8A73_018159 [Channa argus]
MEECLGGLRDEICLPYLDDNLVHSKTFDDHLSDLRSVLHSYKNHGVKLTPRKCEIFKNQVRFLGRLVTKDGYTMDPADIAPVQALKQRKVTTVGELRKLLGFVSYYRSYIPNFSRIAKPLYDLLSSDKMVKAKHKRVKKDKNKRNSGGQLSSSHPVTWLKEHQQVLCQLIDLLSQPPVLGYPDFEQPFTLHCDASQEGLGAVLYQKQQGKLAVVAYGSRTLTAPEKNYHLHSGKLEFLALKWAICERFRDYLYYAPAFTVYTDNNPLTYVLTTAKLNATTYRWVAELADFQFSIKYRPGRANNDADGLSRMPFDMEQYMETCTQVIMPEVMNSVTQAVAVQSQTTDPWLCPAIISTVVTNNNDMTTSVAEIPKITLREAQREDPVIGEVLKYVLSEQWPKSIRQLHNNKKIAALVRQKPRLHMDSNGLLYRKTASRTQLLLPKKYHQLVYKELHEGMGHLGVERVLTLIRDRFYWPHMQKDVEHHVTQVVQYAPYFLLFGRNPRLPIDLMFGLAAEDQSSSHTDYAEKWRARMTEAYQLASNTACKEGVRRKVLYDKKAYGAELYPGCRVLIRNLNEKGGPGKLRSFWEDQVYVVIQRKHQDSPVYELKPENGKGRTRVIHRNLLLPCDFLPVEEVKSPGEPSKSE